VTPTSPAPTATTPPAPTATAAPVPAAPPSYERGRRPAPSQPIQTQTAAPAATAVPIPPASAAPKPVAAAPAVLAPPAPAAAAPTAAPAAPAAAPLVVPTTDTSVRRIEDIRRSRTQTQESGGRTVIRESGRTIVRDGSRSTIRYDETERLRAGARDVAVQQRGGDTVTTVVRPDGARVVTIVDRDQRLLRRSRVDSGGREIVIIDNTRRPTSTARPLVRLSAPRHAVPRDRYIVAAAIATIPLILETLQAPPVQRIERPYALDEIRYNVGVRDRMRRIDVDTITFETGSWEVAPDQAAALEGIAGAMRRVVERNPAEVFLVEGHTDAVGADIDNLSLSDRRAEAVAIVLTDRFGVPPENLTTQGYGEEFLKMKTTAASRENRRVSIRRITPLLSGSEAPAG
jgi:OOP family OmpA-OmpF porin